MKTKNRRWKCHEIVLSIFKDEESGKCGLAHSNAIDIDTPFNAFWDGTGIFHDVFEHWFEDNHKYFRGENAFNVGGETAAMGAAMYYYEILGVSNRANENDYHTFTQNIETDIASMINNSITSNSFNYGHTYECGVPRQIPHDYGGVEILGDEVWANVKNTNIGYDCDPKASKLYKESVTEGKIKNLFRWGARKAERLVPDNWHNIDILEDFINYWEMFCDRYNAEEIKHHYKGITFKLYKYKGGEISWTATLNPQDQHTTKELKISSDNLYIPWEEDFLIIEDW